MVRPCGARVLIDLADAVLHQCIRPRVGACAPGHHGYQRACDLISGQASNGPFGSPVFACAGKTDPPSSFHPLADLGGQIETELCRRYLSLDVLFLCSCLEAVPSSRPAPAGAPRAGAVKAGRRAGLAPRFHAAGPRLDGSEHGATITLDGTPSHRS